MKKAILIVVAGMTLAMTAGAQKVGISFRSGNGNYWQMQTEQVMSESVGKAQVVIRTDAPKQTFKGWGTTFNELDYEALKLLSDADQQLFIKRAFNPKGDLRLGVGRIPVGASDYATDWYSCDETTADGTTTVNFKGTEYTVPNYATDFAMEHFTIARDKQRVIPFIKLAQAENSGMSFWASPWSPPSWMKVNKHYSQRKTDSNGGTFNVSPYDNDQFIDDPAYYNAYCLYFDKFIQAYKGEGINITGLAYQNEAYSNTPYPGCSWTAATTGKFLAQYLGPYMAEHQPSVDLILGTMNTNRYDVYTTILNTTDIDQYIDQIGFQWEGGQQIGNVRAAYPDYEYVMTESECGSGTFDWAAAEHTFQLCNHYLANGCTTYSYWNAILKDNGVSPWGWVQNALVQVNSSTNTATYCPEYFAYKHYTHLIPEGSQILTCDETNLVTSALTPDGNVVIVVGNPTGDVKTLTVDIDGKALVCTVAAKSFASYVVGTEANVAKMLKSEAQGLVDVESAFLTSDQIASLNGAISANTYSALKTALASVQPTATIYNPSFESDAEGWSENNIAASGDFKQATVEGKTCWNSWSNNFTSMDIHQDLNGLLPGIYEVSAKSLCGEGNINDQHVYAETSTHLANSPVKADDVWDAGHWETQATPQIYVAEGDFLRVGYASTSGGGTKGWFCVTDFVLTRVGDLTEDFDLEANRKPDPVVAAKTTYREKEDEARLLAANTMYDADKRSALVTLVNTQAAQLDAITSAPLVKDMQRALEEQMAAVRATLVYEPQAVGEGTYFLYDLTADKYVNYRYSSTNFPELSDMPTRITLASNDVGTYAIAYDEVGYMKMGYWEGQYTWTDADDANNTKWTFSPVDGKTNTYTVFTNEYTDKNVSGTYYLTGSNASSTADDAHEFILIDMPQYVNATGDATYTLISPKVIKDTKKGWNKDNNESGGYAEKSSQLQSGVYTGYGIAHWRGSAISDSKLIYQTVSDLPAGKYVFKAAACATTDGTTNNHGYFLYANDEKTEITSSKYDRFTVEVYLASAGNIELGIKAVGNEGNTWTSLADMELQYLGNAVTIDETQDTPAVETENANVKLIRTLSADYWNTLCLPFSLEEDELAASPLAGASIKQYDSVSDNTMSFTDATDIKAGMPYLVKPAYDIVDPLFTAVKITETEGSPVGDGGFTFTGLLYQKTYDKMGTNPAYLATDGSVKRLTSGGLKGLRAWFNLPAGNAARIMIDDRITAIESILTPAAANTTAIYDLSGRRVEAVTHGLYIQNGKIRLANKK